VREIAQRTAVDGAARQREPDRNRQPDAQNDDEHDRLEEATAKRCHAACSL
jgi:hypothetical protein